MSKRNLVVVALVIALALSGTAAFFADASDLAAPEETLTVALFRLEVDALLHPPTCPAPGDPGCS